jgi:DNA-directed RNA polymerase specialized sigma24 family protein
VHVFGDLSFRAIAEQLSIPENTAQSRWRYALDKLRRHLRDEDVKP